MRMRFCLLLSFCWAFLSACQTTPTPTPAPAEQPQPTVSVIVSATSLATAPPATATAAPPTAASNPAEPTWHQPDPAAYLPVFNQLYADVSPLDAPQLDKQLFEQFLQRDKELYFADGWPSALTFFTTPPAAQLQMSTRNNLLTDIVMQGFVQYLNEEKIDLNQQNSLQTEASQATFTPLNLKGDGSAYWLVELKNDYLHSITETGLLMIITQDNTAVYQVEKRLWADYFPPENYQIFITDVAGSPAVDLVIFMTWYMSLGQPELLLVYSAEAEEIVLVEVIELSSTAAHHVTYDLETDVTGDNRPDIQIFYPEPTNLDCPGAKTVIYSWDLNSIVHTFDEIPVANNGTICSPAENVISEPTPSQFSEEYKLPDWQQVGGVAEKYQIEVSGHPPMLFLDYMRSLTHLALKGKLPAEVIDDTIAQFPKNDPAVDPYRAQLLFMQGYQHEQQGETEKALIYYLALINSYPTSVWSLLAQTRVQLP